MQRYMAIILLVSCLPNIISFLWYQRIQVDLARQALQCLVNHYPADRHRNQNIENHCNSLWPVLISDKAFIITSLKVSRLQYLHLYSANCFKQLPGVSEAVWGIYTWYVNDMYRRVFDRKQPDIHPGANTWLYLETEICKTCNTHLVLQTFKPPKQHSLQVISTTGTHERPKLRSLFGIAHYQLAVSLPWDTKHLVYGMDAHQQLC